MRFNDVPAGAFLMGSDGGQDDERPPHRVHVDAFAMAIFPVTRADYISFLDATGHAAPRDWTDPALAGDDRPVVGVSWHDASAYCAWRTMTGSPERLPTEAEWERAARGTDGRRFPWDEPPDTSRCNYDMNVGHPTPVGVYPQGATPEGLYDVAGNVWEWIRSLWGTNPGTPDFTYPYDASDGREDLEAPENVRRVLRGGGFYGVARSLRCASRRGGSPDYHDRSIGFRVVVRP